VITQVSAETLSAAISRVVGDTELVERAAMLGARIRAETSGAANLASFVDEMRSATFAWPTAAQPIPAPPAPPLWNRAIQPAVPEAVAAKEQKEVTAKCGDVECEAEAWRAAPLGGA